MADWQKRLQQAARALQGKPIREQSALLWKSDPDLNLTATQGGTRYFRPLTGTPKDLRPYDQTRMLEVALYLYQNNALARLVIERRTNYVVGEGVRILAKNEEVQEVIDNFWTDPYNRLDRRIHGYVNAWRAYGELILPVSVNDVDGSVRLGFVSPDRVTEVVSNPLNIQDVMEIKVRPLGVAEEITMPVIRIDQEVGSESEGFRTGQVFYVTANALPDMVRGLSDLWAIADYCDAYETTLWDLVQRAGIVNAFVIKVTKEGATQEELDQWWLQHGSEAPRAGEIIATNEKEKWEFLTPDFTGQNVAEWTDLILSMIATGAGMPKFWLNASDDPAKGAAEQMSGPVVKGLIELQREFVAWVTDLIDFVIDQAIIAQMLPRDVNRSFTVEVPEISGKDLAGAGQTFLQSMQGLSAAKAEKLVDIETGRKVAAMLLSRLGVEVTAQEIEESIEEEEEDAAAAQPPPPPQEQVPYPGEEPKPGVPGAENTGNAVAGGGPRRTPTPRVPHAAPDGDQSEAVDPRLLAQTTRRLISVLEDVRDNGKDPDLVFQEARSLPYGPEVLLELVTEGKALDGWLPTGLVSRLSALVVMEHPGQHNQKVHGRRGPSDGTPASDEWGSAVSSKGVKKSLVGDSPGVNVIMEVTLKDGTQLICKADNGGAEVTDKDLADFLNGNKPGALSQQPEVAAANLDRLLGLDAGTPQSAIVDLPGVGKVLAQEKIQGLKTAENNDVFLEDLDPDSVARVAVLDDIMGNIDRHGFNIFAVDDRLVAVDNGLPYEYADDYNIGSGKVMVSGFVRRQSLDQSGDQRAWEASKKVIEELPDVDYDTWEANVSDGSRLGNKLAEQSYRRYRRMKETGILLAPSEYRG